MKRFLAFFRESYEELRKVVWPSRNDLIRHTAIVLGSVLVVMVLLIAIDYGLSKGVQSLINISQK